MTARTLMVVGTMSSAGKSLLVAALCRIFARRGISVAPFKAQNMSNNAAVCPDGGEIGRAQALQAMACGLAPTVDMNPVLIKPEADARAQVVLMGRPWQVLEARDYFERKAVLWDHVTAALDRLRASHDLVIIEGAGSAAELNLMPGDIVNLAVARYAGAPVLLVGDIDRGGIFAQLIGTVWLLEPGDRALIRGLVVNKFRGDPGLFADGIGILEERSGVPVLGVVPWVRGLNLPEEDAVALETQAATSPAAADAITIAVLALPLIANFDDFDALAAEPGVRVRYARSVDELGEPHAIVIPGTKSTIADLAWLRETGLADAVRRHAERSGAVVGICGGYQMLGRRIADPDHVESASDAVDGLGLLPVSTEFLREKSTFETEATVSGGPGWMAALDGTAVRGYEIHMGTTPSEAPWLRIRRGAEGSSPASAPVPDGGVSSDGRVWGSYLHGLFGNDDFRHAWLASLGWQRGPGAARHDEAVERSLTALADAVEAALDMERLEAIVWGGDEGDGGDGR